jgi:hypothetical protein
MEALSETMYYLSHCSRNLILDLGFASLEQSLLNYET